MVARALLPLALFSTREFGLQSARLSMPQNFANAIAPIVFTAILDRTGHQTLLVFSGALICLALVAIALLIRLIWRARARTDATKLPP